MNNERIAELEKKLNDIMAEIERLKSEEQSEEIKPWRAEHGENYYHISQIGNISVGVEIFHNVDDKLFNYGNYYRTKDLAEQDSSEIALRGRVRQVRDGLCEGYQFGDSNCNWYVIYNAQNCKFEPKTSDFYYTVGAIYFDTEEHAKIVCDILNSKLRKERGE